MTPIRVEEIKELDLDKNILVDVRTVSEQARGMIEGAISIDVNNMRDQLDQLDKDKTIIIYCAVGVRGHTASRILKQKGYKVRNLLGGYTMYQVVTGNYKVQ
jgi:rhodanese-related sulfurtransferase